MWLTVLLGVTFLGVQGYEYYHLYTDLNLKLSSGAYGSTFFMLTGFHGLHVFIGMLMLLFITLRLQKRPLHAGAPLRLRRRGLVLALRRRGVARPVHPGLLALSIRDGTTKKRRKALFSWCSWNEHNLLADRQAPWLDVAELPGQQDAEEQKHREADPNGERARHAAALGACRRARPSA